MGFVPEGRPLAFVADVFCRDNEHFSFGDIADVDCSLFADGEQHLSSGEEVRNAADTALERRLRRSVFAAGFGLAHVTGGVASFCRLPSPFREIPNID